jgi:hypothetical protein
LGICFLKPSKSPEARHEARFFYALNFQSTLRLAIKHQADRFLPVGMRDNIASM